VGVAVVRRYVGIEGMTRCGGEEDGVNEDKGTVRNEKGCEASGHWQ